VNRNTLVAKLLTPAGFIAALALFLLPLLSLSCSVPTELAELGGSSSEVPQDASFSFDYTGVDLILNGEPSVTVTADGTTVTYDGIPDEGLGGVPSSGESSNEMPAVPSYIQIPMIGAAALLVIGILVSFLPKAGLRKGLVSLAAVASAGALAYVVFMGGKDFGKEFVSAMSSDLEDMPSDFGSFGFALENDPGIGFWAIGGVLVLIVLMQAIPVEGGTPAAAAPAGFAPPPYGVPAQPAPGSYGVPGQPAAPAPGTPPSA
jgi:hypothetical protein